MKKFLFGLIVILSSLICLSFIDNTVNANEPDRLESFTFDYTYHLDGGVNSQGSIENVRYGDRVNIDQGTHEGYTYIGYVKNNKLSLNESTFITVTEHTSVQLFYKPSDKTAVILMDANQDFIGVWYTNESHFIDTTEVSLPNYHDYVKPGLSTGGWTLDGSQTIGLSSYQFYEDTLVYIRYHDPLFYTLNLTVTNGTGTGLYKFNEMVTVTPGVADEGYRFHYWEKDGYIVSYDESYTFTMAGHHQLNAVYIEENLYESNQSSFINVSLPFEITTDKQSIIGQFKLSQGQRLVDYGFVHSNSVNEPTLLTSDTAIEYSGKYNSVTNEYVMTFSNLTYPLGRNYRAFITTIDSSNVVTTTYSEVIENPMYQLFWYYNADGWDNVYLYSEYSYDQDFGTGVGLELTYDDLGWWYGYMPIKDQSSSEGIQFDIDLAFNNGLSGEDYVSTQTISTNQSSGRYINANGAISETKSIVYVTTRVYFANTENWNLYVAISGNTENDYACPGTKDSNILVEEKDGLNYSTGWFYVEIETNKSSFTIMFNDNGGTKTKATTIYPNEILYFTLGSLDGTDYNLFEVSHKDDVTAKIYFKPTDLWDDIIYFEIFGSNLSNVAYPGRQAFSDVNGWVYVYVVSSDSFYLNINDNGSNQTRYTNGLFGLRTSPSSIEYVYWNGSSFSKTPLPEEAGYPN